MDEFFRSKPSGSALDECGFAWRLKVLVCFNNRYS